jgi:phosphoribosyl 1,2-cyclic phosphate phosphodiesterase
MVQLPAAAEIPSASDMDWPRRMTHPSPTDRAQRELLFLGTGTSTGVPVIGCDCEVCQSENPRFKRLRCSVIVTTPAGRILIDTTPDLRQQFLRENIPFAHAVLFTHHHADHVFGLDDVRTFSRHLGGPLPIYCEPATEAFIRRAFSYAFDEAVQKYPAGGVPKIEFRRFEQPSTRVLDQVVVAVPLEHGRYRSLGFRFDDLAYCTDVNRIPDESWPLLEGVEILILDSLRMEKHPTHFSLDEALEVVERLRPRTTYLTHLSCQMNPERAAGRLPDGVFFAYDGLRVAF